MGLNRSSPQFPLTCHAIIVGGDDVSYGQNPQGANNWREKMLQEVTLDASRTHFLGKVPYDVYRKVLQVSAAHVYLTYPFVLSWSMLEAMASGCLIVGSDTAPVREVISNGNNGLLVDFFSPQRTAEKIALCLHHPADVASMRQNARVDIQNSLGAKMGERGYRTLIAELHGPAFAQTQPNKQTRQRTSK
jgi:glycosyltransferase involved in cell wall biosynthesis